MLLSLKLDDETEMSKPIEASRHNNSKKKKKDSFTTHKLQYETPCNTNDREFKYADILPAVKARLLVAIACSSAWNGALLQ